MKRFGLILSVVALSFTLHTHATAKTTAETLSTNNAITLAADGSEHFWNALHGSKDNSCTPRTFDYKDAGYVYLCEEFDTKEKLSNYLNETFTNGSIEQGLKDYDYMTYNGKLAHPIGDGFSMLDWDHATAKLVKKQGSTRTFEFTVPTVDGDSVKRHVTFAAVGSQWKITTFDVVQ